MFSNIVQTIFTIATIIFSLKLFIKGYKDSKSDFEKVLYIMLSLAIMFPLVIYYLDRYNLPTKFGYTKNIVSTDWINILTNYSAVIFSTLINAVFLIYVTFKQIKETYKDNMKLNDEMQRLQNLPFLRYNFTYEKIDEVLFGEKQKWIFSNQNGSNMDSIDFTMEIGNIGLNAIRKVYIELATSLINKKECFELCNQSIIEKNEIKKKEFIITNVAQGTYKIDMTIYYQDLLKNWYKQKVHLTISVTNLYDPKTNGCSRIDSVVVEDEEKLLKAPSIIKNK